MNEVKLICGVITGRKDLLERSREALSSEFGPIDNESDLFPFEHTKYYEKEMGTGLVRKLYSFEKPIDPGTIADIKLRTIQMEEDMTRDSDTDVQRVVNLDPGYISLLKLVLATTKDRGHRIYLRDGIFAEVTLQYVEGGFQPLPSTYPDYRQDEYRKFFGRIREEFRKGLHT